MLSRRLIESFNRLFDALFPKHRLILMPGPRAMLSNEPVRVIDIGGAMGADERWAALRRQSRFMFFEPDARSQDSLANETGGDVVVPAGLAGSDGQRTLYLTEGPFASSLYKPNEAVLKHFTVWPWYIPAGEARVPVRTLDGVLAEQNDWTPDFIKVDVEGADLEVLKAGEAALAASFGLQIEVSFLKRNADAPGYGEADTWLRAQGFVPHLLIREHWVRQNSLWGANSNAQLAWGDAVYFRPLAWVLARLAANPVKAARDLSAFVAILLAYGGHDVALDTVRAARDGELVPAAIACELEKSVKASVVAPGGYILRGLVATLLAMVPAMLAWPLGGRFRRAGGAILSRQFEHLIRCLSKLLSRGGLERGCITDKL